MVTASPASLATVPFHRPSESELVGAPAEEAVVRVLHAEAQAARSKHAVSDRFMGFAFGNDLGV